MPPARIAVATFPFGGVVRCCLVLLLLTCATGASCSRTLRSPFAPWTPPAPEVLTQGSSLDQVIAAVNANAARLQSYQTTSAKISVQGMPGTSLAGHIAAQRPGRLRLVAKTALTGNEVDLGSNDELFWFWVRRNEPPALYFARHDQYAGSGAQQLMPIEPQWLLDALGFAEFSPNDAHQPPRPLDDGRIEITSVVQSRTGQLTKRTIVDARRAWVLEQHVYDSAGSLVASAIAKSHRYYPQAGVSLPQVMELRIPPADLALTIDVGTVEINSLGENPQLWALPTIPGSPPTDLGATPASAAIPRMGDQVAGADWYGMAPAGETPAYEVAAGLPAAAPIAPNSGLRTQQSIDQVGTPSMPADPMTPGRAEGAQRLPSGGVPATGGATY